MRAAFLLLLLFPAAARAGVLVATVTDQKNNPIEGAVVYVKGKLGKPASTPAEAVMDQVDMQFKPYILPVLVGTRVQFPNKDQVHHNLYSFSKTKSFELPLYKGTEAAPVLFDQPGVVKMGCNIHDWMSGYVVVLENPHYAVTDASGVARFTAPNGAREVAVWSDRLKGPIGPVKTAVVGAETTTKMAFKIDAKPKVRRDVGSNRIPKYE